MTTERYRVRVTKDHLVFSAAHFITFNGNICERLHGHNWRVAVEVAGPLDENSYVFDFIALRDGPRNWSGNSTIGCCCRPRIPPSSSRPMTAK